MKKSFLFIFSLLSIGLCTAQIGINTQNPQGVFNIDPRGNTSSSTVGVDDDIIVTSDGSISLGAGVNPTAKLHIKGDGINPAFILDSNGSDTEDYILTTTDASSNAKWIAPNAISIIEWYIYNPSFPFTNADQAFFAFGAGNMTLKLTNISAAQVQATTSSITLPAGTYLYFVNGDVQNHEYAVVTASSPTTIWGNWWYEHKLSSVASRSIATAETITVKIRLNPGTGTSWDTIAATNWAAWYKLTFIKL